MGTLIGTKVGKFINSTAFENCLQEKTTQEIFSKALKELGYSPTGYETLVSGITGQLIKSQIFVAPCLYQRLRHLVDDKKQARGRGPVSVITKEATEGRKFGGGLRFGEMEINCLEARGVSEALYERLNKLSNETITYICDKCKSLSYKNNTYNYLECPRCGQSESISATTTPHTIRLLHAELAAMNIEAQFNLK